MPDATLLSANCRRAFARSEMAAESQRIRADGRNVQQFALASDSTGAEFGAQRAAIRAPATRINYYTVTAGVRWAQVTRVGTMDDDGFFHGPFGRSAPRTCRAGERTRQ